MELLIMITQFLLGISIIVGLHELGHMLFARAFGMRVEKYAIGFPPKLIHFQWRGTEYSLGAIPLGGSVKIAGMMDEYLDKKQLAQAPQPWEFRAKPAWQRWLVMMGGIIFNIITGILIFITLTYKFGDTDITKSEMNKYGIMPNALGTTLGFQEGDKIVNINGKNFNCYKDIIKPSSLLASNSFFIIERKKKLYKINITQDFIRKITKKNEGVAFIEPLLPFCIHKIIQNSAAEKAGLQSGDQLISIAGKKITYFQHLVTALSQHKGKKIALEYIRNNIIYSTYVQVNSEGKIGFYPTILLTYQKIHYSLWQSIPIGLQRAFDVVWTNVLGLKKILTGKIAATQSLSGPIGIAKIFGGDFNWIRFWEIIGLLSMVLAFINFLPIPALDGGHALFLIYEMIIGRSLPVKFLDIVQRIGILLLLGLAIFTIVNDVYKLF